MYWSRSGNPSDLLAWLILSVLVWLGGWLIGRTLFQLRVRERLFGGLGIGLLFYTLLCNLLAHRISLPGSAWSAAILICAAGVGLTWYNRRTKPLQISELLIWKQFLAFGALFCLFLGINRGLALFDDYLNLPFVSRIATGDIPPHFYLNPDQISYYHYGLHLLAAGFVRVGGFFPWSAWDFYKAITIALTIVLGTLWFRRYMNWQAAILWAGFLILLAGGARWILLLLPDPFLKSISAGVQLIGSGLQNTPDLPTALTSFWKTQGDGPIPFPFAFVNGIFQPLIMALGSSGAMPNAALFLLLLLARRRWSLLAGLAFGLCLAALALFSETHFVIIWGGIALAILLQALVSRSWHPVLNWGWTLIPGAILAPVMGGVLSTPLHLMTNISTVGAEQGLIALPALSLRWPPAILSSHLGELSLFYPPHLLIALAELGIVLFSAPVVLLKLPGYIRSGKLLLAGLGILAAISFLVPILVRFMERDRDISRLSGAALDIWLILGLPYLWRAFRIGGPRLKIAASAFYLIAIFGGAALLPIQLITLPKPQISYYIQETDARMSRRFWNVMEPYAWVLDPAYPYRPAALFGRTSGPAYINAYTPTLSFRELAANPIPDELARAGYSYVYLDRKTWLNLTSAQKQTFHAPCVQQIAEEKDPSSDFRRLYHIANCQTQP